MSLTYLTTEELAGRIKYNARTIRNVLKDSVLLEGRHYVRPFGGRKILFIWENIEQDMFGEDTAHLMIPMLSGSSVELRDTDKPRQRVRDIAIPMARGSTCHG